jgi:hypothetical protein
LCDAHFCLRDPHGRFWWSGGRNIHGKYVSNEAAEYSDGCSLRAASSKPLF